MKTILVPTTVFDDDDVFRANLIKDLCKVDPKEWSPREKKLMENAMDHGELYHMMAGKHESYLELQTDLGDPGASVMVRLPVGINEDKAIAAFQKFAEELM